MTILIFQFLLSIIYIYNLIWNRIILEKQIFEYYFYNSEFFSYSLPRWYIAWKRKMKERNSLAIGAEVISPHFYQENEILFSYLTDNSNNNRSQQ